MKTFTDYRFPGLSVSARTSSNSHIRLDVRDDGFAQPFRASLLLDARTARALALELTILADELEIPNDKEVKFRA